MLISIVTASYNYAQYITETIQSVLNQTYKDWELIIVDDGSSDNSVAVIKSFCEKDERIKLFTHENNQNKGLTETLKLGISKSQGEWITFLESDDLWAEDCLEQRVSCANKAPIIFNDVEIFGDEKRSTIINSNIDESRKQLSSMCFPTNIYKNLAINNLIPTFSSVMIKAEILKNCNFETPKDKLLDWWLYIHLTFKNEVYYINEKLTKWRVHPDSYINKETEKPMFVQLMAYSDVYKSNKSFSLLILTLYLHLKFLFSKKHFKLAKVFIARKIKKLLGLKLKN